MRRWTRRPRARNKGRKENGRIAKVKRFGQQNSPDLRQLLLIILPLEHTVEGAPGELGAFDAGGHVRDVLELGGLVQIFQVLLGELLATNHGEEKPCQTTSLLDRLAGDEYVVTDPKGTILVE